MLATSSAPKTTVPIVDFDNDTRTPEEKQRVVAQERANRIDALSTMTAFSQALAFYDRKDYENALRRMVPVVQASPNSMLVRVAYEDMKHKAATTAADKAKDKLKSG